jgi:hypothetical protein
MMGKGESQKEAYEYRIREGIARLLASQRFAVLSTAGSVYPYGTLIAYAATGDLRAILFATMRKTRKHRNMERDPRVSLLIDSRPRRPDDIKDAEALTALGTAKEVHGKSLERFTQLYLERHPYLADFIGDPHTALMRISVRRYILVRRFQEVFELNIT